MKSKLHLTFLIVYLVVSQPAYAQISEFKITASDGAADDYFGNSVSISGDYAVVGAPNDDDNGSFSGSAFVFSRSGTTWAEQSKLLASDGAAFDDFGVSVSISGDYTVVGASEDVDNGVLSGSAYLFIRSGTSWVEEAKLLASDGAADDVFGISVSVSGDNAIVGARSGNAAYVYSGIIVGIDNENVGIPVEYSLSPAYPNPFNPTTTIEYSLPQMGEVSMVIYNLLGEEVKVLVNEFREAGKYEVKLNADGLASGVYIYTLHSGEYFEIKKMLLLK